MSNLLKSKLNSNQKNNNGLSIKQYSVMKKLDRFLILTKFQHYLKARASTNFPLPCDLDAIQKWRWAVTYVGLIFNKLGAQKRN